MPAPRLLRPALAAAILAGATTAAAALAAAGNDKPTLRLEPCDVQAIPAGCGTLFVPEDRARPQGRKIGLNVVLIPARHQPAEPDAFAFLAGGPGVAATSETYRIATVWAPVRDRHDILLVDQRGTGRSHPLVCSEPRRPLSTQSRRRAYLRACAASLGADPTLYGTRAAMDDLDAVRRALGYEQLDVYGASYGATAAQVYLRRHRAAVRTLVLDGATELGVPFYSRFARNAQRALEQLSRRCDAAPACARRFPRWRETLERLVRTWNRRPIHRTHTETMSGDDLAGAVQSMLLDPESAAAVPLLVSRAAAGDYGPLNEHVPPATLTRTLMFWSIWCNEPWVGLDARGPWHTLFDGYTAAAIRSYRQLCAALPRRDEQAIEWRRPHTTVPMLALVGGADPQDPIGNLPDLRERFPNGHAIVVPSYGHTVAQYGCLAGLASIFVDDASSARLDERCVRAIRPPPFVLSP